MGDAVVSEKSGEKNGNEDFEITSNLETETLSKSSRSNFQDTPQSRATHVSLTAQKKDADEPVLDKPGDKLLNDKGEIMRNPRRKSRSGSHARSQDPKKCQMNFRDMIGKHEMRNEELGQLEGDLRERLDMLECSMPAVMVWNILRTAQGAPPSVVRRLMEKQLQGIHSACNIAIPSSPSQHYDHRVREIEAERKEAVRRAEEARALLTDKEAAIQERRKRLEEVKKCNEEKKERVERLHREAVQVRESMKTARGDDTPYEAGECGAIRCKEKLLGDIGSLSSIGSTDLEYFAKLQELVESEVCMKQQISELEHREEVYMRTLQQADELWSKMEGESSDDVRELQKQLSLKTAANQQLADRVCQLEDEQERLKKRLITCTDQLAQFTDKGHAHAEVGFIDGVATIMDHGVEAQVPTATTFTSASPQTFDVDSTASPQTKDAESIFSPESVEKGISVGTKVFDKDIEAVVDLVDRGVDGPVGLVLDASVGDETMDDSIETIDDPSGHSSDEPPKLRPEEEEKIPETLATSDWDDGSPPGSIPKDMVESSTGTDTVPVLGEVPTAEMPVQATVEMIEQMVGGSEAEDIAEKVEEVRPPAKDDNEQDTGLSPMTKAPQGEKKTPSITQAHKLPIFEDKSPVGEPPKAIDEDSKTMDDERKSEIDESIEVIDEPLTDELRFKKPAGIHDKNKVEEETISKVPESKRKPDRSESIKKDTDVAPEKFEESSEKSPAGTEGQDHGTTQETGRSGSDKRDHEELPTRVSSSRNSGISQPEEGIAKAAREPDGPVSTGTVPVSKIPEDIEEKPLSTVQEDTKKESPGVGQVSVAGETQLDPRKEDSLPGRREKSPETIEVIPEEIESDLVEGLQTTHYSDPEEKAVEKYTRSVMTKPKDVERKERKGRSSKHKPREEDKVESDDDEDIPEAWKDWDWDRGCPPDLECNISTRPIPIADKHPKNVSTLESQVQATVEMRERSVGGRGSEDIAEIERRDKPPGTKIEISTLSPIIRATDAADPTEEKTDEIVLSREELRNWYNTVNSIHHTISQCVNCHSHVNATAQLMSKMNNHLWIMALADEEVPVTDAEPMNSLGQMAERPIESVRDLRARASEPKKSDASSPAFIAQDNLNDLLSDMSQLLDEDPQRSSGKDESLNISTAKSVTLSRDEFNVDTSTDQLVTLPEAEPSQPEIEENPLDEDDKETPKVSPEQSLQVPVEDELSMPLEIERRPLSQEEPSAIIDLENQQAESAKPPTAEEEGELLESEEKQEDPTKPPEKIIDAEQRMEEEQETTKQHDVDKSPALKPESEPEKKQQPLGTLEECVCSPQICRPVITCIPEPATGGTQTAPRMPRTLHRLMLKTKAETPRRPPEVITWHRPLIWTRRREDKSTLTTARVGIQTDSTLGRERITHRKIDRKDDCTCSGLIPKKIDYGESCEDSPRRHPDERLPTPVRHTVAEPFSSLRPQPSAVWNEHEIAVTQYTSKTSIPKNSDSCCVECGKPITSEPTPVSSKANVRANKRSPDHVHTMKKLSPLASEMEQIKNLCCDCEVLRGTRTGETPEDMKSEFGEGFADDDNLCCPCPIDKTKETKDSIKRSKKKRKPEKKDQCVTANIPRSKQKKTMKNKKNLDDNAVSSKPESQIYSPLIKSSSKLSGNSVTESYDDKSCNKIVPDTARSVKRSTPKISSPRASSPCECIDKNSAQVPYTNYSATFGPDSNRNECRCSSSNESTTDKSPGRKYDSQQPN